MGPSPGSKVLQRRVQSSGAQARQSRERRRQRRRVVRKV